MTALSIPVKRLPHGADLPLPVAQSALAAGLDLLAALRRIDVPTWFINGQYDQLRLNERLFVSLVPGSELIVVPRTTHLVTARLATHPSMMRVSSRRLLCGAGRRPTLPQHDAK